MRAILAPESPGALSITRITTPTPGPGEVLITVAAAGVNRADLLQAAGHYPPPPGASNILGLEVSGTITALGAGVTSLHLGDQVVALTDSGGYASSVAVPIELVLPLPSSMDLVEGAGLMEAACTVWSNLFDVARLRDNETILIHGGSGGIGSFAIQVAKVSGAKVIATARTAGRAERCHNLGADHVLAYGDYSAADGTNSFAECLPELIGELTEGHGADVILDVLGAAALGANVASLATGGRLVVIGMQQGVRAELNLGALLTKRASVHGTTLRARPLAEKARIINAVYENLWPMIDQGELAPVIHAELPLAQAQEAHDLLKTGEVFGKLVLIP